MSIAPARLNLKFPTLARLARPDACAVSSTPCQSASNLDQCFKSKQQTLPFLRATGACKNDRVCQFVAGAQAALMPHADVCHHLAFGFHTEAAAAKIQQGGA
ncbi:hypothetical protein [uncultured Desulfovibrio sp.]|uniref:hypothetical protein n=1 Tax=uncultured Desulfovibrio sp. TaxID=167968 RepID=UPI002633F3DC|nr:hypothetical protein [uncultured Desulfovibrio sp.]